jgi:hypothetical protein
MSSFLQKSHLGKNPLLGFVCQGLWIAKELSEIPPLANSLLDLFLHDSQTLRRLEYDLQTLSGYNYDSILIPGNPVSRLHDNSPTLDGDVDFTGILSSTCIGNNSSRKYGEPVTLNAVEVANGPVNHNTPQALQPRRQGCDFTPERSVQFALAVDHENAALGTL